MPLDRYRILRGSFTPLRDMKAHFRPPKVMSFYEKNWKILDCAASDGVDLLLSGDGGDQLMLCFAAHDLAIDFISEGIPIIPAITNASMIAGTSAWDIFWKLMVSSNGEETKIKLKTSNIKIGSTNRKNRIIYYYSFAV